MERGDDGFIEFRLRLRLSIICPSFMESYLPVKANAGDGDCWAVGPGRRLYAGSRHEVGLLRMKLIVGPLRIKSIVERLTSVGG